MENGWGEWKNQILAEQTRNNEDHKALFTKLDELNNNFITFKACIEAKQNTGKDFFSRLLAIASLTIAALALLFSKVLN